MLNKAKLHLERSIDHGGHQIQRWRLNNPDEHKSVVGVTRSPSAEENEAPQKDFTKEDALKFLDSIPPGGSNIFRAKGLDLYVGKRSDGTYYIGGKDHNISGAYDDIRDYKGVVSSDMKGKHRLAEDLVEFSAKDHTNGDTWISKVLRHKKVVVAYMPLLRDSVDELATIVRTGNVASELFNARMKELERAISELSEVLSFSNNKESLTMISDNVEILNAEAKRKIPEVRKISEAIKNISYQVNAIDETSEVPYEAKRDLKEFFGDFYVGMTHKYHKINVKRVEDGWVIDGKFVDSIPKAKAQIKAILYGHRDYQDLIDKEAENNRGRSGTQKTIEDEEEKERDIEHKRSLAKEQELNDKYRRNSEYYKSRAGSQHSVDNNALFDRGNWHKEVAVHIANSEKEALSDIAKKYIKETKDHSMRNIASDLKALGALVDDLPSMDDRDLRHQSSVIQAIRTMHNNAANSYSNNVSSGEHVDLHTAHLSVVNAADKAQEKVQESIKEADRIKQKQVDDEKAANDVKMAARAKAEAEERRIKSAELAKRLPEVTSKHKQQYPDTKKWKKQKISVAIGIEGNKKEVDAKVRGVWAIHKDDNGDSSLTHIPTGVRAGIGKGRAFDSAVSSWIDEDPTRAHKGAYLESAHFGNVNHPVVADMVNDLYLGGHIDRLRDLISVSGALIDKKILSRKSKQ